MPPIEHYPHHHFLPSTSPFSTWNALALTRSPKGVTVHKLLLHSKCLRCRFEAEISCVWSVCVETIQGFPLGYPPPIVSTILEALNRRSFCPSLPLTNNLKGCDTYEGLVGLKAILSKPFIYIGWSKIADTVQIWPHKTLQSYRKSYQNARFLTTAHAYA